MFFTCTGEALANMEQDVCEITGEVWKDEEVKEEVKVNENGVANGRYQQPVHK